MTLEFRIEIATADFEIYRVEVNWSSNFIRVNLTQTDENQKSLKNPKVGCGGFHFHLPVINFYVLVRNLEPTYSS